MKNKSKIIFRLLSLLFSILITGLILYFRKSLASLSQWGYLGIFLLNLVGSATVLFPVPGLLYVIAAGAVLHPLIIGLLAALGSSLGEFTAYLTGYGGQLITTENQRLQKIKQRIENSGFPFFILVSFIPNPAFDLAGIAAGILNYPFLKFFLACLIGRSVRYILLAYLGSTSLFLWLGL